MNYLVFYDFPWEVNGFDNWLFDSWCFNNSQGQWESGFRIFGLVITDYEDY